MACYAVDGGWTSTEALKAVFVLLYVQGNSYGHVVTIGLPNHTFFPGQAWTSV